MSYDPFAVSLALIEHGVRDDPPRLSRRRRFAPMAVDVAGDVACTLVARRGAGYVEHQTHLLVRRDGSWHLLGGGGAGREDDGLDDRPAADQLGGPVVVQGGGSALRDAGRRMPWGARYVHDATLRAAAEVDAVVVDGRRRLPVPRHGHLVVVWAGRRPPAVTAHGTGGELLAAVPLRFRGAPEVY